MSELIGVALLKNLVPTNSLKSDNFQELASKTMVETITAGTVVFKKGDRDTKAIYLLEGDMQLTDDKGTRIIRGGGQHSKHPLANRQPRDCPAKARSACKITRIDTNLLDILMTWDQLSGIEVDEIGSPKTSKAKAKKVGRRTGGDDVTVDWMTRILQSKAFLRVPPANIQALFMRVKEIPVKGGTVVVKQGDVGDNYYIIKQGKCKVTRNTKTGSEVVLAHLSSGDAFGEEALLSGAQRNANVVMVTDGSLASLSGADFNELLKDPILSWVTSEAANRMVREAGAIWLDVRLDSEHKNNCIQGSMNIPLFMLRLRVDSLDAKKKYILYCDTGKRSSAGAFLLGERGIDAHCLKGGLVEYKA